MKKLHLTFGIITLAAILIGLVHGGIAWIVAEATWDPSATGFPTWGAFVLPLMYYGMAAGVLLLAWGITWGIACAVRRRKSKKGTE